MFDCFLRYAMDCTHFCQSHSATTGYRELCSFCANQMESNLVPIITLLVLLFVEQLVYGLFYSDLSFITASFFPTVASHRLSKD